MQKQIKSFTTMYVSDKTIEELANKGINVRWFNEPTYDEHKKVCWEKEYNGYIKYYGDEYWQEHGGMDAAREGAKRFADMYYLRDDQYNASKLFIDYEGHTFVRTIAGKSTHVTAEQVLTWVDKDRKLYSGAYGEFATKMQQIMKALNMNCGFVYPTTYGIGLYVYWNWKRSEHETAINKLLDDWGIEYYNEYSDAQWVYRYKISKKSINLSRIK